jgi:predicted glycoside hydrolase/deacetylase ChbG (UPF0249 family)
MSARPRRFWLCADDYGMAPGINAAIRRLILDGRLNATSIMTVAPFLSDGEAGELAQLNAGMPRALLGLHVTLTAPFRPMSAGFAPLREGAFLPHTEMLRLAMLRRLPPEPLAIEIATQLRAFVEIFGRPPDFVDGHQHAHIFPVIREAFLRVVAEAAPNAWVRQCGRARGARSLKNPKSLVLDLLSVGFRARARRLGLATNPAFAGAYDFRPRDEFARLFPGFLNGLPEGGLIMCHPGFVDEALKSLDPVTVAREREFAFLQSDAFPQLLARRGFALANPAGETDAAA